MRYLGGKGHHVRHFAPEIYARTDLPIWDVCCGGLGAAAGFGARCVLATDVHPGLIALYKRVQRDPSFLDQFEHVSEEEYCAAKRLPDSDPRKAFIGFACSWGGMYFRGYARGAGRNYAAEGMRKLKKKIAALPDTVFVCADFLDVPVAPLGVALYVDPPYEGTMNEYLASMDRGALLRRLREWSEVAPVFVSEYDLPIGQVIWGRHVKAQTHAKDKARLERLYQVLP